MRSRSRQRTREPPRGCATSKTRSSGFKTSRTVSRSQHLPGTRERFWPAKAFQDGASSRRPRIQETPFLPAQAVPAAR
jgi:hypothetical protein